MKRRERQQGLAAGFALLPGAILAVVLCAAALPGQQGTRPTNIEETFRTAQQALQAGRYAAAEAGFRKVLRLDPRSAAAYANLGVVYLRMERFPAAVKALDQAVQLAPQVAGIQLNLGLAYIRQSQFQQAIPHFRRALELQPQQDQARYLLGLSQYMAGDCPGVVKTLEPLYSQFSSKMDYLYILGSCYGKAGNEEQAARVYAQMFRVEGDSPRVHWLLGNAYLTQDLFQKALEELEKARADPTLPYLHYSLGLAYYRLRKMKEAQGALEEEIRRNPQFPSSYGLLGAVYLDLREVDKSIASYQRALQLRPNQAAAFYGLGRAHLLKGDVPKALAELQRAEVLKPDDDSVHFQLGQAYRRLGRKQEAEKEFARAQELQTAERQMLQKKVLGELPPSPIETSGPPGAH